MKIKVLIPTILISLFLIFKTNSNSSRNQHSKYLAKEYLKLSKIYPQQNKKDVKPDNPGLADLQNYYMTIDPKEKRVPHERLLTSYKYSQKLKQKTKVDYRNSFVWNQVESNMGGRTRGIMWDPTVNNKVWACSVTGGLWYNKNISDDNSKWKIVDNFWPGLSTNCITYDPNDPNIFYVGTGEYHTARVIYRESSGLGYGIWKTTDAGKTWNLINSTKDFNYISDIKVRNENGISVIYAGVVSGNYKGTSHISNPSDGLYRSNDGGQNWEQVLPLALFSQNPYAPSDLEISASGKIFVGTLKNIDGKGGATILSSTTGLKGSWQIYNDYNKIIKLDANYPIPGRVIISTAPSDKNIVYAIIGAGYENIYGFNYANGNYILRSNDAGNTWKSIGIPLNFTISVNPTDPNNVFIGGLDLWKTINGGEDWKRVSDWWLMTRGGGDRYVHADMHWILYKPNSSNEAIFSTDGGIFYSSSANKELPEFEEKNLGYSTLQFYSCDINPEIDQNIFIGGLQDNGSLLYTGTTLDINNMISGGDGAYCFFDDDEPNLLYTSIYYNKFYLFDSLNYQKTIGIYGTGVFINPCDLDSKNNIIYTNACSFIGDRVNQLIKISNLPDTSINTTVFLDTDLGTYFSHIKVSPHAPLGQSTLFVGSQNGRLFKITNAQSTPLTTEIGSNNFPEGFISCVSVGGNEDTLMVTFSNYGVNSVWETHDGGDNWKDISYNLPDMPVRWALYHPKNSKLKMLATELGIWYNYKENLWSPYSTFPNVRVDMLKIRKADNTVLAASHGQGLFWTKWDHNPVKTNKTTLSDISIYPNPSNGIFYIEGSSRYDSKYTIRNLNGKIILKGNFKLKTKFDLIQESKGIYLITIQRKNKIISRKIIIF